MRIAAVADIHCPRYLIEFITELKRIKKPDVFLLAGDMIEAGRFHEYQQIAEAINDRFGSQISIIACFGNDEQGTDKQSIRKVVKDRIRFLDGDSCEIHGLSESLGIFGVPMFDAAKNNEKSTIQDIMDKRIKTMHDEVLELLTKCDWTVLLMHYSPLSTDSYPESLIWWISEALENTPPNWIVHGHIHYATNPEIQIGPTRIMNVAFPATRKITEIELGKTI
ncbi:MAG: metallophosphoesterase [Candidatus Odinarchaeota archaeon]